MYRFFVFLLFLSIVFFASDVQFAYTSGDQKTGVQPAIMSLLLSDAEAQSLGIKVYDANDKFLGFYVEGNQQWGIFLPGQKNVLEINLQTGDPRTTKIGFESTDCTGTGYCGNHYINRVSDGAGGFRYYKHVYKLIRYNLHSRLDPATGACEEVEGSNPTDGFEAVEISAADVPALPVALPLRLE